MMENFSYPNHPFRCIITCPLECGKYVFRSNLILNIINEYEKRYIYAGSLHQDLYQNLFKCFNIYIPIHILPNFLKEKDFDLVFAEVF